MADYPSQSRSGGTQREVGAKRAGILDAARDGGQGQQPGAPVRKARATIADRQHPVGIEQRRGGGAFHQRHAGRGG
ncbi:hypothetical protein ACFSTD_13385 [Novosphingobium colocasiae]